VDVHRNWNRDPGYKFDDEFHPSLKHDNREYYLWLIQVLEQTVLNFTLHTFYSWLDGKHTVLDVVEGQDVDAIAQGDLLESVEIVRVGEEAEKWNAIEAFIKERVTNVISL
jgi:peptidyl-prolyl cis-trans isomerase A (cyclophilin A)